MQRIRQKTQEQRVETTDPQMRSEYHYVCAEDADSFTVPEKKFASYLFSRSGPRTHGTQ